MPKKAREIEAALLKKGFIEDISGKHKVYRLCINKKDTGIVTHTSHGSTHKEVCDNVLNKMAKQMRLTRAEFDEYVKCNMKEIEYKQILVERNYIEL